jgi:hypothetical protein
LLPPLRFLIFKAIIFIASFRLVYFLSASVFLFFADRLRFRFRHCHFATIFAFSRHFFFAISQAAPYFHFISLLSIHATLPSFAAKDFQPPLPPRRFIFCFFIQNAAVRFRYA